MARKPKQDLLDFSRNRPSWADRLIERDKNAESEADAAIQAMLESGELESVSEEQRQDMIRQIAETGDFDLAVPVEQPIAEEPEVVLPQTEDEGFRGFPSPLLNTITSAGSLANETEALANVSKRIQSLKAEQTGSSLVKQVLKDTVGVDLDDPELINPLNPARGIAEILSPQLRKQRMEQEQAERETEIQELTTAAQSLQERIARRKEELPSAVGYVAEKVGQASGNPESYLATIGAVGGGMLGGPGGAAAGSALLSVPAAKVVYDSSLNEAKELGATEEEAIQFAYGNTAIEFGTEAVLSTVGAKAAGFFGLNKLAKTPLRNALVQRLQSRTSRVAAGVGSEAFQEAITTRAQDELAYQAEENEMFSDPAAREKLRIANAERKATEVERMLDSAVSGMFGAGPTVGVVAAAQYGAEIATQEQGTRDAANENRDRLRGEEARRQTEIDLDIAREEERIRNEEAQEAAFQKAEQERATQQEAEARQKEIEEEAGQRTIELERQYQGRTRVEKAPGITERIPVNPPAEVTPEQVEQERVAEEQAAVDATRQKEQAGLLDEIQKRQKVRKTTEGRSARLAREKAEKEEKARRRKVLDDLIKENPDADPAQLLPLYQQRLAATTEATPAEAPTTTPTPQTAPVARPAAPAVEGQVTSDQQIEDMRAGLGLNMEPLTPNSKRLDDIDELVDIQRSHRQTSRILRNRWETLRKNKGLKQQQVDTLIVPMGKYGEFEKLEKQISKLPFEVRSQFQLILNDARVLLKAQESDSMIDNSNFGLSMEPTSTQALSPEQSEAKRDRVISGIVRANKNKTADVQNLIRQGKIVVAANPEEIGRSDSGVGTYDSATGTMYLYTDRVDESNLVNSALQAALHEPVHAGQFNENEARSQVMRTLMSPESNSRVNQTIRQAARSGNTIAQAVVEDARKAAESNPDFMGDVESLELAPYLATRVEQARGKPLGQIGGAVRDVLSNARNFLRERTGLDLDITIGDLATATQQAAGEIVNTELTPEGEGTLQIEAGSTATGFRTAQARGETYTGTDERSERFEIPDENAELYDNGDVLNDLAESTTTPVETTLFGILEHDELYKQYPWLKGYKVSFEQLGNNTQGYHDPDTTKIAINDNLLRAAVFAIDPASRKSAQETIRSTLLHEAQHAVQNQEGWESGANAESFMPKPVVNDRKRAQERMMNVIKQFDLGAAVAKLPPQTKRLWENEVMASGTTSPDEMKAMFLDEGYWNETGDRMSKRYAESTYLSAASQLTAANLAYKTAEEAAFRTYLRDRGEAAARNTEQRSRMNELERTATPFNETLATDPMSRRYNVARDDLIDTTPFVGGARGFPRASSLDMAATTAPANKRRVPMPVRNVFNLFDHALGVGKEFNEMIEFATSSPAEARMIAERSLHVYNESLADEAVKRGVSPADLNEQIQKELDAAVKDTKGYNENYAAFQAVAKKYGAPGQAMLDMRNQIDALTKDILQARLSKGTKLTANEKKLYETLLSNLGRYTHRQYATNAGKIGDKFSKMVWDDYNRVKEGKKHNEAQLKNYKRVDNAVKYLVNNNLYIPDAEGLQDLTAERVEHLYDVWVREVNPSEISTDQMREALLQVRDGINGDTNRMEAVAEDVTKELIGISDPSKSMVTYFRGGKQDNAILRERQNIPVELRELMGEIKDPAMRMMLTVAKQAEFVARNKMLLEIANNIGPQVQPPTAVGTPAARGLEQVTGPGWGPLEGYYISRELKNRLQGAILQLANFEQAVAMAGVDTTMLGRVAMNKAVNAWGKVAGTTKAFQIIGKPVNFLYNYMGAYRQLVMNGNVDPRTWAKAHKAAVELIAYATNPEKGGNLATEANKYGITDSAFIGELRSGQYKELAGLIKEMAGMSPNKAFVKLRKAGVFTKEMYAMMDVWSKLANFYHETDVLTSYYDAAGIDKSEEAIKREAADRANRTNITYKRAAPLVKGAEKMGLTAFGTYFYEVFRSEIGNAYQGVQDLRTAAKAPNAKSKAIMAGHAATRLSGQVASWAATYAVMNALASTAFGDDDEDKNKRWLLPEYLRNKDFIPLGRDEEGNVVLFDFSRIDPAGPMTDLMRSAVNEDADLNQIADDFIKLYVAPRIGSQLINAVWTSLDPEKKARGKPLLQQKAPEVYKELTDIMPGEDRVDKAWINVVETALPGIVSGYKDNNTVPVAEDLPSAVAAGMTYAGASMYKLNPRTAAQGAVIEFDTAKRLARRDFGDLLKDYPEGLTQAELADKLGGAVQRERETFNTLVNVYKGMKAHGMTEREISVMLKDLRLTATDIAKVKAQEFESNVFTGDTIESKMKQEMIGKSRAEKAEIKEKWDNIKLMIEGND